MASNTPTFCNYCEGQAFENGRCTSCGASSWKAEQVFKPPSPEDQPATHNHSTLLDLFQSAIHLVEKLASTAMTIIKYKLIFIFACLSIFALAAVFGSKPEPKNNESRVTQFKPMPLKAPTVPTAPDLIDLNAKPVPFEIPATTWGKHFNPDNLVPDKGFLAFYFDRSNTAQLVHPVQVDAIDIDYSYSDFRAISSQHFGAYYVGVINARKAETIEVITDRNWNEVRVLIDGELVQEHSRGSSGPAKLVTISKVQRATQRSPGEKVVVLPESIDKVYPKSQAGNPMVTLTPGDHLVEIELLNHWHTTDFSAQFKRVRFD